MTWVAGQAKASSFPTATTAAASIAGALVARSVGRQRRRLPAKQAKVQRRASTLDQLKEVTGKEGGIPLQLGRSVVCCCESVLHTSLYTD